MRLCPRKRAGMRLLWADGCRLRPTGAAVHLPDGIRMQQWGFPTPSRGPRAGRGVVFARHRICPLRYPEIPQPTRLRLCTSSENSKSYVEKMGARARPGQGHASTQRRSWHEACLFSDVDRGRVCVQTLYTPQKAAGQLISRRCYTAVFYSLFSQGICYGVTEVLIE